MIKKVYFDSKWIREKHREIKADPLLIERAIYVFELLGELIESGVDLVFKGGTSLMILIPELKRLSIDLDIITPEKDETLEKIFNNITEAGVFKRWEPDKRISKWKIPKKHFKFFYNSLLSNGELYILLDVLQINSPFPKTIKKSISPPIFDVEREVIASMPTINGLTGDKLTAFAPTTIGIRYGSGKSMEIIKQLFDLGILFEHITDLKEVSQVYEKIAGTEARFRKIKSSTDKFLNDSIETAFLIIQLDFRGGIENDYTTEIRAGIRSINTHVMGQKYRFLNAKEDASKIACLASLLKDKRLDLDINTVKKNRTNIEQMKNINLPKEHAILNKLKSISPASFYLWAIVTQTIKPG
jgi:hypothetical protein